MTAVLHIEVLFPLHLLKVNSFHHFSLISVLLSVSNPSVVSREKLSPSSPRLPSIHDPHKKTKLAISIEDDHPTHQMSPLSLTYAQLYHGDLSPRSKKKSQSQTSLLPPINNSNKRNSLSNRRNNTKEAPPNPDKYIRLPIAQLRRLQVSSKYIKEAKKLYFNAATKVFVPRHAIVEMV